MTTINLNVTIDTMAEIETKFHRNRGKKPLDFGLHFIPLMEMLELNNIPHKVVVSGAGMKIVFPDGSDVALNYDTYGCEEGLLEGYLGAFSHPIGVIDGEVEVDEVTGGLTADEAFKLICIQYAFGGFTHKA